MPYTAVTAAQYHDASKKLIRVAFNGQERFVKSPDDPNEVAFALREWLAAGNKIEEAPA